MGLSVRDVPNDENHERGLGMESENNEVPLGRTCDEGKQSEVCWAGMVDGRMKR